MEKVRLGFIGAGWWATSNHMPLLAARDDVEMAAVCRLGARELEAVRERFGFAFATEDYHALLEQPLDAVVVTSPHGLHYEHARAALTHGLHVMVEKPMALRGSEARELAAMASSQHLHLLVPYGWNYKPFVEEARRHIDAGAIGTIEHVLCHMASPLRPLLTGSDAKSVMRADDMFIPDPKTWADPAVAGGGYGQGQLTHALGLLFFLVPLRAERVYAEMHAPGSAVDLYDALSVRFVGGATGAISGAGTVPGHLSFQVDVRIFGSEGMLLLDIERERLEVRRADKADVVVPVQAGDGAYVCDSPPARFIDLIRGRTDGNNSSGEIAARSVEVLDAAYRSAQSGRTEEV
jgi:predicted dehydrogenase